MFHPENYLSLVALLLGITLAACEPSPVGSPAAGPAASDALDCRAQAARHVELRYPRTSSDGSARPPVDEVVDRSDRAVAERRFYQECLQQKHNQRE